MCSSEYESCTSGDNDHPNGNGIGGAGGGPMCIIDPASGYCIPAWATGAIFGFDGATITSGTTTWPTDWEWIITIPRLNPLYWLLALMVMQTGGNPRHAAQNWPPCIPPVGTIGYRLDEVPPSRPHQPINGDHVHLYKMNQNPTNGQCFWQPIGVQAPPPPLGAVPMTEPKGGTIP